MKQDKFLAKLEERFEENKRLANSSWLPKFVAPIASYMAFHTFRVLFWLSLGLTALMTLVKFEWMMEVGRRIFFYRI